VLKKRERKRSVLDKASKVMTASLSNSSNTSNASVNKELEHWVALHDKKEIVAEDVREIGKTLGVNFDGGKNVGLIC
jgi:methionine aminopeptidase